MSRYRLVSIVHRGSIAAACLILAALASSPAEAQLGDSDVDGPAGRVEFDFADAPTPIAELDLSRGMLEDVALIGQGAIVGVVEALLDSSQGQGDTPVQQSAEALAAVNEIVETLTGVVHELRVRVYVDAQVAGSPMIAHYQEKLKGTNWDNILRARDGNNRIIVCALRRDGAIRGIFVIMSEREILVMANVVCEISPENTRRVTNQLTKVGLKIGLEQVIQEAINEIKRELN